MVEQIIQEQKAQNHSNTFYDKVRTIAEELNIKLEKAVIMKKSDWKRTVKDKIQNQIQESVEKKNKTKLRKRRRGHQMPYMQSKGRCSRTCTRVSSSRNSIQNKR